MRRQTRTVSDMSNVAHNWTNEALRARLRAQSAVDTAPRRIAALAARKHMMLARIVDNVNHAELSAGDAIEQLEQIARELQGALSDAAAPAASSGR